MTYQRGVVLLLFAVLVGLIFILFIPRSYSVAPFIERKGTQYWDLPTGSHIGYTHIKSKRLERKPPIIYLHGGPGGIVSDYVIDVLTPLAASGYDVYFYDQIGCGHSARLGEIKEYTVDRHKEDLKEIISTIGAEKAILIGQSWGAVLAINYLQESPQSIDRMILTGPGPILPIYKEVLRTAAPDSLSLKAPEYSNHEGNKKVDHWRSKFVKKWAYLFGNKLASDDEMDDFMTVLNQELNKSTNCFIEEISYPSGSGYYSHIMTMKSIDEVEDRRAVLNKLKTPILIMRGQCDNQNWGFTQEYLDFFPHAQLEVVEGVGHNIAHGDSTKYQQLIRDFLTE